MYPRPTGGLAEVPRRHQVRVDAERHLALELSGMTGAHEQARGGRPAFELGEHPGLAHARLATNLDGDEPTAEDGRYRLVELRQLRSAAHQCHAASPMQFRCSPVLRSRQAN